MEKTFHFDDLFRKVIRLSDIKKYTSSRNKFINEFGVPYVLFGVYHEDRTTDLSSITFAYSSNINADIDKVIDMFGDIRVSYGEVEHKYDPLYSGRCGARLSKKKLIKMLCDIPDDAMICVGSIGSRTFYPLENIAYCEDANAVVIGG